MLKQGEEEQEEPRQQAGLPSPLSQAPTDVNVPEVQPTKRVLRQQVFPENQSVIAKLDRRISEASSSEALELLKVRKELIEQDELIQVNTDKRRMERWKLGRDLVLSLASFATGTFLVYHNTTYPGMFMLGATLFSLAPEFVKGFFKQNKEKRDENEHN